MNAAANLPEHLKVENILRAFNANISDAELADRAKLMCEPKCTSRRITSLNNKWKKA
jgi:hypothetical protein